MCLEIVALGNDILEWDFLDVWNADSYYVDFSDFGFTVIVNLDLVVGWVPYKFDDRIVLRH